MNFNTYRGGGLVFALFFTNRKSVRRAISSRINDEPGPGKHDFLISVTSYPPEKQILFFLAKYLIKWNKSSSQNKTSMCGNALFEKL